MHPAQTVPAFFLRSYLTCSFKPAGTNWTDGLDIQETGEQHTGLSWGNHLEYPGVDGKIILKWILKK
jgi:hypothetical protein